MNVASFLRRKYAKSLCELAGTYFFFLKLIRNVISVILFLITEILGNQRCLSKPSLPELVRYVIVLMISMLLGSKQGIDPFMAGILGYVNLLKPSRFVTYHLTLKKLYVVLALLSVFCADLRTDSDFCCRPIRH